MSSRFSNISSVAKYESKLLMRSWFYRIFLVLAVLVLCIFNFASLVNGDNNQYWILRALPSNIPYINLLLLNTGQAVIAVFLSSEFLKADKKLDTSEVFYVHPLSNAEYVIGKIWGNMNVFFRLNLIIIAIVVVFNFVSGLPIDWMSYLTYFLVICVPTLIYIFGLSIGLMLILKNQAITFVLLLGYIALTLFYIADKFYYLFDYMVYNLPLVKSSVVGFTNLSTLINHRLIYLFIGLGFICISIFLFRRLPNTKYGRYRWLALSCFLILAGVGAGYRHVNTILRASDMRKIYTGINNKYVNTPQMVIENYDISVEQYPETISATVTMQGKVQESSSVFTFCLNPSLQVSGIKERGKDLKFTRDLQIVLIDFGRVLETDELVTFAVSYNGRIDEDFCYLDIPDEFLHEKYSVEQLFNIDKRYSFQTDNYVLFTPETYWYPRPGVAYSNDNPDWQRVYFSKYRLTVKTINGLQALSQGARKRPLEKIPVIRSNEFDSNDEFGFRPAGGGMGGGMFFMGGGPMGGGMFGGGGGQRNQQVVVNTRPGGQGGQGGQGRQGQGGQGQGGQGQGRQGQGGDFRGQRQGGPDGEFRGRMRDGGDSIRRRDGSDSIRRRNGGDSIRRREGDGFRAQGGPDGEFRGRMRDGGDSIRRREGGDSLRRRESGDSLRRREGDGFRAQGGPDGEFRGRIRDGGDSIRRRDGDDSLRMRGGIDSARFRDDLADYAAEITPPDSIFIFETDFPAPAISLIIGDYEQKCMEVDHTIFSLWHLKGNDYFVSSFDSVMDTIPYQVRVRRQAFESQYMLNYSFKRFSLVEVPVQLKSYVRTWTQAQEVMQPEMLLLPEKGCTFNNADFKRQIQFQKTMSKRQGMELSDRDAAIRVFNGFLMNFQRSENTGNFSMERGAMNITSIPNPFFMFPQLYNFRYNIFSSERPVANRMIELYLQDKADNFRQRQMTGISNNEKANLLIQKRPFKELLTDPEQRDILDNIISLKTNVLFAPAERNIGNMEFRDSLRAYLYDNRFKNIQFEDLLTQMGKIAGEDLLAPLDTWDAPTNLPVYIVGTPEITYIINRDVEVYVVKLQITNDSDFDGIINVETLFGSGGGGFGGFGGGGFGGGGFGGGGGSIDPRAKRKISLEAHETKQLVTVWDEAPRAINVNTLISANLPNLINMPVSNIIREQNVPIAQEGDFILANVNYNIPGEVIVDNEDVGLFELSKPDIVGLLPIWLEEVGDNSFPYQGVQGWRPPLQWTLTTNDKYYGTHIRSAYVIKNGSGSQTATWKVPVPRKGLYDLYYHVYMPDELRRAQNNRGGASGNMEYHFKVKYDDGVDNAYINLRRAGEGWSRLGTYYFSDDTIRVTLANDISGVRMVTADAVKIVKRETSADRDMESAEMARVVATEGRMATGGRQIEN